ncbi:MAG: PEGA domain-containing protein [Verrucomicrobiota bacterium]
MPSIPRLLLVCVLAIFAFSGCETVQTAFRSGLPQTVTIDSVPASAEVYINGDYYGITPVTTELPRKVTHEVVIERDGYVLQREFFTPQRNELSQSYIRFGIMEDLGLYFDLTPGDMVTEIRHSLIPVVVSNEPFEEMTYRVMLADALLESGSISKKEHSVIYEKLTRFYTTN